MKSISSTDYSKTSGGGSQVGSGGGQMSGGSKMGGGWTLEDSTPSTSSSTVSKKAPGKAMQLGKPKKQNELMKDLQKEKIF